MEGIWRIVEPQTPGGGVNVVTAVSLSISNHRSYQEEQRPHSRAKRILTK
jgi:hypothetical protein